MKIAAPTRVLQGFLAICVARIVPYRANRRPLSRSHHPTKTARAKGGVVENCPKSQHGDALAQFARLLSL
jgi:hypothetical protein